MSVKIFYGNEIRRLPLSSSPSLEWLRQKVRALYENLDSRRVKIYWKDFDNDKITIGNNEDLFEALRNRPDDILRLYLTYDETAPQSDVQMKELDDKTQSVTLEEHQAATTNDKKKESEKPDTNVHKGVICDGCETNIKGRRYKCIVCPDFDLCGDCEGKNLHAEHPMLRLTSSADHSWRKLFRILHRATLCNLPNLQGEPYLSSIGELLTGVLKHWGVDVDYEVRPPKTENEQKDNVKPQQQAEQVVNETTKQQEKEPINVDIMEHERSPAQPTVNEAVVVESTPQDWEIIDKSASPTDRPSGSSPTARIYPETVVISDLNARVADALAHMMAMGFNNDDDWLKHMLYRKNGDIPAVLDVLQPKL